jgi:hypothetical protein
MKYDAGIKCAAARAHDKAVEQREGGNASISQKTNWTEEPGGFPAVKRTSAAEPRLGKYSRGQRGGMLRSSRVRATAKSTVVGVTLPAAVGGYVLGRFALHVCVEGRWKLLKSSTPLPF